MASVDQTMADCREIATVMKASNEMVRKEAQLGKPLIQRVPEPLRSIENGAQYFNPEIVAIGPYHRHNPQLQPMEVRERYLGPRIEPKSSGLTGFSLFSSAMELTEVGVRFRASDTSRFGDISFCSGLLFGWLSLPPIQIDDTTQAVITNMVAFENCAVGASDYGVGSYLSLLALIMSKEEDVKELRLKKMIFSDVSDKHALAFLKSLDPHLGKGENFMQVLQCLNDYYNKRRVRIFIHKMIYRNFKFILAATSVIVFFVTILQTIFTVYPRK